MARRLRFFVLNEAQTAVINRALAQEIGLIESVLLMQIEFLISISSNERDGRYWTYQSLANLHNEYFPYWSKATLGRAMQKLVELELVTVGNYNRSKIDRTPWYTLNPEGLARLRSLRLDMTDTGQETPSSQYETSPRNEPGATSHHETTTSHPEPSASHGETAIPETTSEITQREEPAETDRMSDPTPIAQYLPATPEDRLAQFEATQAAMRRMRGLG